MADRGIIGRTVKAGWALRDEAELRRRLGSIGHVLTGNLAGTLLGLLGVAIAARALGPHDYGILVLIITYVRAIERLVSFQSWQPMIRYGAGLDPAADGATLRALFKFGLLLDIGAGIAAWAVAIAVAWIATKAFGWSQQTFLLTSVYSLVLLTNLGGMPTAVLRLAGRFRAAAYGQVGSAIVRVGLGLAALLSGASLWTFVLIWMATQILGSMIFLFVGFRHLRRQGITGVMSAPLSGVTTRFPGLWAFTWSSNLSLTLRSSANQLDTLLVGGLVGPAEAGLYHIAKQIGKMAAQIGSQAQAVLYPDIARLWAEGAIDAFRKAVLQVEVLLALFGVAGLGLVFLAGEFLLRLFAGPAFAAAAPLLTVQMLAVALTISGTAMNSALLAMGHANRVLGIVFVGTLAFHAVLLLLVPRIGAMGANVAHVVLGLIWLIGLGSSLRRALRNAPAAKDPIEAPIETTSNVAI
jgi:O-antigen/teichoic acid export membrane protein